MIEYRNIPAELQALRQWVAWRTETRKNKTTGEEKPTKVLKNPRTRGNADSTKPSTWGSIEEVVKAYKSNRTPQFDGIGFVVSEDDEYTGIDLDKCRDKETGETEQWALDIIGEVDSYSEVSPSGTGWRIIVRAKLQGQRNKIGHVEMYDHARYFTITGNLIPGVGRSTIETRDLRSLEERFQRGELGPQNSNGTGKKPKQRDETESGEDWRILDQLAKETGAQTPDALEAVLRERYAERYAQRNRAKGDHAGKTYWRYTIDRWFERRSRDSSDWGDFGSTHEDASNAVRFAKQHSDEVRYWHGRNKWMLWLGAHWQEDELAQVAELAKQTAKSIYGEAATLASDDAAKRGRWAERSLQSDKIRSMLVMAKSLPCIAISTNEFDGDPRILNFLNGTVDLRTGVLHEHRREDYITKIVRCNYNPGLIGPRWQRFLEQTFGAEVAVWIQKAVGYSITGDTSEKCVFLPWGPTDTGKTTFLETLRSVFEDYSAVLQIDTLMWNKSRDNNTDADLADLRGARFVTTSETEEGQRLREAKLKRITQGMGQIKTARKYENPVAFKETHKLWMDCNHQPMLFGTDDAIWNRLLPIPCTHKLEADERDRKLKQKLLHEAEAIAAWAVAGAVRWYKEGLGRPAAIEQERKAWRERVDILGQFIAECCTRSEEHFEGAAELYAKFKEYAEKQGHRPMTSTAFGLRMAERGFNKEPHGASRRIAYLGIRLLRLSEMRDE